jgi:hypothetical protein
VTDSRTNETRNKIEGKRTMHVDIMKPNRLRMRTKRKGADDFRKGVVKLAGITKRSTS